MQLQMTAPLDIGLEQADAQLGFGQDDVFDLGGAEKALHRKGVTKFANGDLDDEDDEMDGQNQRAEEEEEELDSEEERERKVRSLEAEMDGLYESYRQKLADRDSKFMVKEARKKNKDREETWGGIRKASSDNEDSEDSDDDGEGGWDRMAEAKEEDEESSDDDSGAESDSTPAKKRRLAAGQEKSRKRRKLVTVLDDPARHTPAQTSRAAQQWFSQDMFADVPGLDDEDEDDYEDVDMEEEISPPTAEDDSEVGVSRHVR